MKPRLLMIILLTFSYGFFTSAGLFELVEEHFVLSKAADLPWSLHYTTPSKEGLSSDIWFLFDQAETFLKINIPQALQTQERAKFLAEYLEDGDSLIQALSYQESTLNIKQTQLITSKNTCSDQLEKANTDYRLALQSNDEMIFTTSTERATQARTCLAHYQVERAALHSLERKRQAYLKLIQARTDYLKKHQQMIVQHYDILDPNLLSELYQISKSLEASSL